MQLSEQAIDKFIAIYEHEFNEPISREDAVAMARRLINLYRLFLRPPPPSSAKENLLEETDGVVEEPSS